jgi:ankyrin repeat protein
VVSMQTAYRRKAAFSVLKRLRAEAKDLNCIAKERDKYREETRRLREELERAKEDAENRGRMTKEAEVKQFKQEVKHLRAELEKAKNLPVSPTLSHADELGYLARECELKELQLKGLRKDLRNQYGVCPSSSKDSGIGHTFSDDTSLQENREPKQVIDTLRSPVRSPSASMSLLDADNPNEGYLDRSFEATRLRNDDVVSKSLTTTTLSLSYSMNTPNLRGEEFFTGLRCLHEAVRAGDLSLVEEILRRSSEEPQVLINEGDEIGRTSLHVAVLTSNLIMTKTLLEKAAIANAQDNDGETPLHLAETPSMTALLLKEGRANPNIPNIDGICALHLAVQRRDLDSVRGLLLHSANVNSADNVRWFTPLHLIALQPRPGVQEDAECRARIAELMAGGTSSRYEPDLNYQDSEGNCPLHYAVQLVTPDAYDLVKVFLETGADPKVLNNRQQSALHLICHNNGLREFDFYPELLNMVLRHGGDPNQQSAAGCTALHLSLYHRDIDSAVELVAGGAQLHPVWKKVC